MAKKPTTIEELIREIGKGLDDWRDVFQTIHMVGYNSDFTADPSTDMGRSDLATYLKRVLEIIEED